MNNFGCFLENGGCIPLVVVIMTTANKTHQTFLEGNRFINDFRSLLFRYLPMSREAWRSQLNPRCLNSRKVDQVSSVHVLGGRIRAKKVVLCSGQWSGIRYIYIGRVWIKFFLQLFEGIKTYSKDSFFIPFWSKYEFVLPFKYVFQKS